MTCASGLPLPPHFLRACGRVSRPQPGDRFTLAGERAQLDTSHARNRRDVLVGDAQLDGVATSAILYFDLNVSSRYSENPYRSIVKIGTELRTRIRMSGSRCSAAAATTASRKVLVSSR